jgi:hypothetical protein
VQTAFGRKSQALIPVAIAACAIVSSPGYRPF